MPRPLVERFSVPVREARNVPAICNPNLPLLGPDLALHVDLTEARGGDRMTRVENLIRMAPTDHYERHLVTGHSGSGKSTELHRFATELQQVKEGRSFHVVFIDVLQHLDPSDIELPELLLTLFARLWQDELLRVPAQAAAAHLGAQALGWARELGVDVAKDLAKGVPGLASLMKNAHLQRRFREKAWHHNVQVLEQISTLIEAVRADLVHRQEVDDLVIVIDNLEKLLVRPVGDRTNLDVLFIDQLPALAALPVHIVVTFPVSLHARQGQIGRAFPNAHTISIPMVRVRTRATHQEDPAGFAALREFLARRLDLAVVFSDQEAIDDAIRYSGGCIRDLLRIVAAAVAERARLPITRADVAQSVKWLVADYERNLQTRPVLPFLHTIEASGSLHAVPASEQEWLLLNMVVLEYNGETWYDVHPLVRKTRSFRESAPSP